jgi:hypothetical protein
MNDNAQPEKFHPAHVVGIFSPKIAAKGWLFLRPEFGSNYF